MQGGISTLEAEARDGMANYGETDVTSVTGIEEVDLVTTELGPF